MHSRLLVAVPLALTALLASCSTFGERLEPVPRVAKVDIDRYVGPWYIIASIPLDLEVGAHNPVETYSKNPDGTLATVFQYRKDSFLGTLETKPTIAEIQDDPSRAEWKVQLVWPIQGQYLISYLEPDYSAAIVARDKRDHVWILSRTPKLTAEKLALYKSKIGELGYDVSKLYYFPHNGNPPWK